ncbi:YDG/SRA domain-containing protein [Botrytis cinerea]
MGSLGMKNGGVASPGGASALLRMRKEPLPELPLSAIPQAPDQIDSRIKQSRIESGPLSDPQLSSVPEYIEVSVKKEPEIEDNEKNDTISNEHQFDYKDAIGKLLGINMGHGFNVSDIDTEPKAAFKTLLEIKTSVVHAAVSWKNAKDGKKPILEQWRKIKIFLYIISRVDPVTPKFSQDLNLKMILKFFTDPEFKGPKWFRGTNATPPPPAALTIDNQSANANKYKKRKSTGETPTSSKRLRDKSTSEEKSTPSSSGYSAPPASASHIWGDTGIMRGILWKQGGHVRLNKETWDRQMAALRDGAHGAPQAGIVGDKEQGAYSIVISKHYEGFDLDLGDTVHYSAPGAIESITKEADSGNSGVMALRRSIETKKPVRVLRSANCAWKHGPAAGIRYDGLYRVVEGTVGTNGKGGKYWRFTLKRLLRFNGSDQVPINLARPTKEEVGLFEKVKEGY